MPVGAVLLARLRYTPHHETLEVLRTNLLKDLSLDAEEHFYSDGPLVLVKNSEEGPIPTHTLHDTDDCWVNINLHRAYYGLGYERGDLPLFIACAEWLETHLCGCEVWYGHDTGDDHLHLFDHTARQKLSAYYRQVGHQPYVERDAERKNRWRALWPG